MSQRGSSAWDIQNGPFAILRAQVFTIILGRETNSYYARGVEGIIQLQKRMRQVGFGARVIQSSFLQSLVPNLIPNIFFTLSPYYLGPTSYYPGPRGLIGEWINEFERQSLNRRNPSVLEPPMFKNVLATRDSPRINPFT